MIGNNVNKQNTSSLSFYIKLQQTSIDKIQLYGICFDNFPSSILSIYHTDTFITTYKLITLFQNGVCYNGYNIILNVDLSI
jgi:hypothetical protein